MIDISAVQDVKTAYPDRPITDMTDYYRQAEIYKACYEGRPSWQYVKRAGLYTNGLRKLETLRTAKVLADEFSRLSFSEQVDIMVDNETVNKYVQTALNNNGFWRQFNAFLSSAYALGGGVIKTYADNSEVALDYVDANYIVPLTYSHKGISEGVFVTQLESSGRYYTLFEGHTLAADGHPVIDHRLYCSTTQGSLGSRADLPCDAFPGLTSGTIEYNRIMGPMFQYFRPCASNNLFSASPLGLSVYANALDTLKALDIAFDSFAREFVLGRKRIIVPGGCVRSVVDPDTGEMRRYFDSDDEAFLALNTGEDKAGGIGDLKIHDNTVELRVEKHVSAINALLNILCFQVGLSPGSLSFDDSQGLKTATEVVSEENKTARVMRSNKNILAEFLEGVVHNIIDLGASLGHIPQGDYTVTIGFPDNIVIDDNTLIDNNIKLVQAGLRSKLSAIMAVQKCDEDTASKELERINKEQAVSPPGFDGLIGGGEDDKIGNTGA